MRCWNRSTLTILICGILLTVAVGCNNATPPPTAAPQPTVTATPQPQIKVEQPTIELSPTAAPTEPAVAPTDIALEFRDLDHAAITSTVDGNAVQLHAQLANPTTTKLDITFTLQGLSKPLGKCVVASGSDACSLHIQTEGWAWQEHQLVAERTLRASAGYDLVTHGVLAVEPKPVILVHGLNSAHGTWSNWVEPGGYLDEMDLEGYAVGDGQFGTVAMNTGSALNPLAQTLSIAENAQILADYVSAVRQATRADQVDLVGHSLGGLISRYYVQNLMPVNQAAELPDFPIINQLIMAGTPNGGTVCGRVPAAMGFLSPATSQITPEYLAQVFNMAVHNQRGVPFFAIAGDIAKPGDIALRCTAAPTDQLVSVESVLNGIAVIPDTVNAAHTDLPKGRPIFERIFSTISRSPTDYPIGDEGVTKPTALNDELLQTTIVKGGTLLAGETMTITIPIDQARDATFLLYAPGSQVTMNVKTVAGAILTEESPKTNPNVSFERVFDDDLPLSLGYGVLGPKAGNWEVAMTATETPLGGGPFAVVATVDSDLALHAEASPALADVGNPIVLQASLQPADSVSSVVSEAEVRNAAGTTVDHVILHDDGVSGDEVADDGVFSATWQPPAEGEYSVVLAVTGQDGDGNNFERLSVLGIEVR